MAKPRNIKTVEFLVRGTTPYYQNKGLYRHYQTDDLTGRNLNFEVVQVTLRLPVWSPCEKYIEIA